MNAQMEALLAKKQEQLEKAIQQYNQDNEILSAKKIQYDRLMMKIKAEQRELEAQRKRTQDDVTRLKEDEMDKVRKEKKALEQRQKNFQLVSTTAKKEREEIDNLRREYAKYKNDAELKAKKQQGTIERLTKQNNELKQKNKELLEDLKAMEQQRIILERSGPNREPVTNTLNRSTTAQPKSQNRYSFSSGQQNPSNRRQESAEDVKGQLLFREEEEHLERDEDAEYGDQNHPNRDDELVNNQFEDEEEEDLQDEEADQVYDNFAKSNNRGAVANTFEPRDAKKQPTFASPAN